LATSFNEAQPACLVPYGQLSENADFGRDRAVEKLAESFPAKFRSDLPDCFSTSATLRVVECLGLGLELPALRRRNSPHLGLKGETFGLLPKKIGAGILENLPEEFFLPPKAAIFVRY
jgi:hypothetical protein